MEYKQIFDKCNIAINEWAISQMQQKRIKFSRNSNNPEYCQYLNHQSKLISVKPRRISISSKFKVDAEYLDAFNKLKSNIEQGNNLNPYLSKLINVAKMADGMFDHFGCKHFHLGSEFEPNGNFIERTGPLAIGFVTDSEVFFIDVKTHTKDQDDTLWYEQDIVETIHQERPDLISRFKLEGFKDITPKFESPEDIKSMRDINVNTYVVIDENTAYSPINMGTTVAGLSMQFTSEFIYQSKLMTESIYSLITDPKIIVDGIQIKELRVYDLDSENEQTIASFKADVEYQGHIEGSYLEGTITQEFN